MIERQLVLPVSPGSLWEALTDPDLVASWFGGRVEWDLVPGGRVSFDDDDGTVREGRVESVSPERQLRYRWWPKGEREGAASEVVYRLEPAEDGTRLEISERRLSSADASACASSRSPAWTAWDERLVQLWGNAAAGRPRALALTVA